MTTSRKKKSYGFKIFPGADASKKNFHYVYYINPPAIRVISFKGGGGRVVVYTKFIEMAHHEGLLATVEEVGGSSSGSLFAAFTAIHYEDPEKRSAALAELSEVVKTDVYGDSVGWQVYQVITFPFQIMSTLLERLSRGVSWMARKCRQIFLGNITAIPLTLISLLFDVASVLMSPRSIPGLINLISKGGVYRGDHIEACMRDRFQQDTQAGLEAILEKLSECEREAIMLKLTQCGLGQKKEGRFIVVPDITFKHLYELSKLPGSQFKQYYTTVVRTRDKSLVILNHKNVPDMPIHQAFRFAITFPLYYLTKSYRGEKYIDGGIFDNAPVMHAGEKPVSRLLSAHGVTDHLTRLNVRVEYPDAYQYHLWSVPPAMSRLNRIKHVLMRWVTKLFAKGVDAYAEDEKVTHIMREHFSHRTLQLPDFNMGQMENKLSARKRKKISDAVEPLVADFFKYHRDEKVAIKHYDQSADQPESMPLEVQLKLLKTLQNKEIHTDDIFNIPNASMEDLEILRQLEVEKLSTSLLCQHGAAYNRPSLTGNQAMESRQNRSNYRLFTNQDASHPPLSTKQREIAASYIAATPDMRKVILLAEKEYPENIKPLYMHYFNELEEAINILEKRDTLQAKLARNVLHQVKLVHESILQKYELTRISDDKLFDVLHATSALITTPMFGEASHIINPDFTECQANFMQSMSRLKSNTRINALKCAGYGLIALISLIATVVISVFTFGGAVPLTFNSVALGLINAGGEAGLGIYLGGATLKFGNEAVKSHRLVNKMDKLNTAFSNPSVLAH